MTKKRKDKKLIILELKYELNKDTKKIKIIVRKYYGQFNLIFFWGIYVRKAALEAEK